MGRCGRKGFKSDNKIDNSGGKDLETKRMRAR